MACATGVRTRGGGGGGSLRSNPPHPPTEPSGPPRGTWRGGTGFGKRGQDNTPGNGRAEGPAAGGGARAGKQAGEDPPLPTRPPHSATPPPHLSRARLLAPRNTGERQPLRTRSSFSPSPLLPSHPAPRTGGGEAREPGGAGRGPPAPLSEPTALMILPQVHLRKPCYDFYFL